VDTKLLPVDSDSRAFGYVGNVTEATIRHLHDEIVAINRYHFAFFDANLRDGRSRVCTGLCLHLSIQRKATANSECQGHRCKGFAYSGIHIVFSCETLCTADTINAEAPARVYPRSGLKVRTGQGFANWKN
jgi:hypothetical protein